ncbi:hypothetical protein ACFLRF_05965 [Candidatus Altiarchaeota archaeon]
MGYSTVMGHMIVFMTILTAIGLLVVEVSEYLTTTTKDVDYQQESLKDQLETGISLTSTTYDATEYYIYATNTGKTTLEVDCMDVFIDREYLPQDNYSITITDLTFDPTLWNPDESIEINAYWTPVAGTKEIRITSCNGVTDSMMMTVT